MLLMSDLTSADFNIVKPLVEGTVQKRTWLGLLYARCERNLSAAMVQALYAGNAGEIAYFTYAVGGVDVSASVRMIPVYHKTGLQVAIQLDNEAWLGQLNETHQGNWGYRVKKQFGATRMEEAKVVLIPCLESVAITAPAD